MSLITIASDNFNRADGGLGANWSTMTAQNAPQIVSNVVEPASLTSTFSAAYWNANPCPNDQWAQVVVTACATSNDGILILLRAATGTNSGYQFQVKGALGASASVIIKSISSGTPTVLVSGTASVNAGDILYGEIVGTTLVMKINGTQVLTITDSTFASGKFGIALFASTSGTIADAQLDSFAAGGFGSAGGLTLLGVG